jgi:shikimate kinase
MKNIILVGMMSSGKTTLGKKLAKLLSYRFVDLDKLIENSENMSIPEIFAQKGEAYFRSIESKILKQTLPNKRVVIATGGGAPCFFDNMDYIKTIGISIFLDVPAYELAERITNHGKDDRPMLSGVTDLAQELQLKINDRRPFYERADLKIEGIIEADDLLKLIWHRL